MSAWQHPIDSCPACGQDILLRPEITNDVRIVYARYCPHCDAGELIVVPTERAASSLGGDPNAFWATTDAAPESVRDASAPPPHGTAATSDRPTLRRRNGLELWWHGDGDGGTDADDTVDARGRTRMEERWAAFAADGAADDDDDEMPVAAEGSFAFGAEDIGRRRKVRFARPLRLRQPA